MSHRICHVVGARPNFVKAAAVIRVLPGMLVHTGQHYDAEMSETFFSDLEIPEPDAHLGIGSATHSTQTANVMLALEPVLQREHPDLVLVYGDVNSTVAAALVATKLHIPVAHVEAGLRSFDRTMPEEINRVLTDHASELLFTTEHSGNLNLAREGISMECVHFVGNTMIDTLVRELPRARERKRPEGEYTVLTLHRPANVDDPARLAALLQVLEKLPLPVLFPCHPRTARNLPERPVRVRVMGPLAYLDFLAMMDGASIVLTDSGGIQEETTFLGVPCLTLREYTERPITVTHGTNRVVGTDPSSIAAAARETLDAPPARRDPPPLWDGHAAERIAEALG